LEFKVLVDTLASIASLVAIVSVMVGWYRSARRPLRVTRVVVHKSTNDLTFIVLVKNVKDYPVTIQRTDCYRRKKYEVQKKHGGRPEYSKFFPGSEMIFTSRDTFEIAANGHTDIRIRIAGTTDIPSRLLFLLETSHGYHELWCKEIVVVEIGKVEVYGVEYKDEYRSKWIARAMYHVALLRDLVSTLHRNTDHSA